MSSEVYSYIYEKILAEGGLDVYCESIYMKKNRPAYKVSVLCDENNIEKFTKLLLKETSTFGVRYHKYNKALLDRNFKKLNTPFGEVQIKLGYLNGELIKVTPEYEDCKIIAKKKNMAINKVYSKINSIINEKFF